MSDKSNKKTILIVVASVLASFLLFIFTIGVVAVLINSPSDTNMSLVKDEKFKEDQSRVSDTQESRTQETWSAEQEAIFEQDLIELIESSNGSVLSARPYLNNDDWSSIAVAVDDAWYYLQDYEKERHAEQLFNIFNVFLKETGVIDETQNAMVVIVDINDKELASPSVLGGYKIKR